MYIIEVIPLTILPPNVPQILSYFYDPEQTDGAGPELQKGAIVEVEINKRKVKAVAISCVPLEKVKLGLKKADFQIKKINKVLYDKPQVSNYQLKLASWLAKYYYAPLGYTLKTILPPFAFKKKYPVVEVGKAFSPQNSDFTAGQAQPELLIYKTKGLVKHLEPLIKDVNDRQVLIMVSEKASINYFYECFSKKYKTVVVHSGLSNEKFYDAWSRLTSRESATSQSRILDLSSAKQDKSGRKAQSKKPQIVIGTRQALNIPFSNLGLVIVDDPLHEFYKSDMVPRYNAVRLAEKVAELNNAKLILTSVILGVENYYKYKIQNIKYKILEPRPKFDFEIIDMAQEIKDANWSIFSKKLNSELLTYLKDNKKVLLFSPRRGYAGILICGNCGSAVKCPQCEVAMRTHRSVEMILVCHHCGISKPMPRNCSVCGNHNLKTVGPAGTQKIYDEVKAQLTAADIKSPVLALDTDIVKNEAEEEEIISEMLKPGPAVLIATQMVFSHRFYLNFDLIAIINADALTNIPDFRSEENLFYQIEKLIGFFSYQIDKQNYSQILKNLRIVPENKLLIQTYNPENELIEEAAKGDYGEFYERELKLREALNYPPFFKLIKLTFRHNVKEKAAYAARITTEKIKIAVARARIEEDVKLIEAVPAYIEKEKGLYIYNIFLKVRESYENVNELLKYAGPGWIIDVEPRSLL